VIKGIVSRDKEGKLTIQEHSWEHFVSTQKVLIFKIFRFQFKKKIGVSPCRSLGRAISLCSTFFEGISDANYYIIRSRS
jgi:hypothetical protein